MKRRVGCASKCVEVVPVGLESEEEEIPTVSITLLLAKASGQLTVTSYPAETAVLTPRGHRPGQGCTTAVTAASYWD